MTDFSEQTVERRRILLVDDDNSVRDSIYMLLESDGYEVFAARNGSVGLTVFHRSLRPIDLLVTDCNMPGMTGMELSTQVRTFAPRLPIVIMSGYFSKISPRALEDIGHIALLAKPFSMGELGSVVDRAIHPDEPA